MQSETLSQIKTQIFETKDRAELLISEEERVDSFLDKILDVQKKITQINEAYLEILHHLENVSCFHDLDEEGFSHIKDILNSLYATNIRASRLFSQLNSNSVLTHGCSTVLFDFRINIRNVRESLRDLEELFFLQEDDEELNGLLDEFVA